MGNAIFDVGGNQQYMLKIKMTTQNAKVNNKCIDELSKSANFNLSSGIPSSGP